VRLKRAEEALRARELNFQLIVDSIPAPVAVITPTGEVEALNQPVLDYFGKSFEELTAWAASDPVHPDDLPHVVEVRQKALERGETYEIESRHRRADGVYRWFHVRGFPLKDTDGRILRWCVLLTDIEDRKRAEAQLAGEKRLLEMVASSCALADVLTALCKFVEDTSADCHCGVYLIDWSDLKFRIGAVPSLPATFNDPCDGLTVCRETGPCGQAALLKEQVIVTDLEADPLWQESAIRPLALAHGIRSHWSTPISARDGRVLGTFAIFHREPSSPTQVQQDLIAQVTHIASIAIERALSEAALKRSEAFLAEGQRLGATGFFSWRLDTDEITLSEELCRVYELDPNVPPTVERCFGLIHPEDIPMLVEKREQIRADHGPYEHDLRLRMPDGRVKYLRTVGQVIRRQDGRLESVGATQDVTQRRLAEEALDKARSELARVTRVMSLGALTASIAHEVNQPLSGIITNASTCLRMLDADPPNVEGARETARRTIRDGNRASDVVTRLRALFSKKEFMLESLDLNETTREIIALSLSELQRNRVILQSELADDLPTITGDRVQLQQVILNLLHNALDAMVGVNDRPRQLLIRTEREDGDRVRLTVRDAGMGVDHQSMDKLFDAFYTTKTGGMGIGLSVSRSIVERHHGRLWVEPNDGPGTAFSFSIPRDPENATDTAPVTRHS
jgi:PAS domain S-box-containing protein